MDVELVSRLQFALTIGFHYLFPPLSIGLGLMLVVMEGLYLKTKDIAYHHMTRFWVRVFGLIFAIGVATGIVMEFQFGTNWSNYSRYVGDVFGSALAAEGVFAFFLESGFLAVLLFGWDKVSPRMHFFATIMVALGSHFSAIWIIVANSWMHTPAGFHIVQTTSGFRAEIVDFWAVVFNPSMIDRLTHTLAAAWQTGAWLVLSVSAYYLLKNRHHEFAMRSVKIGLIVSLIGSLGQLVTGHGSAQTAAQYQPTKLAAFEGHYPANEPAPLYLFGWVDETHHQVYGVKIPGMLSFLVHGNTQAPVKGLDAFPEADRPPVNMVFQSYHAMVAIGMFLIGLSLVTAFGVWKQKLTHWRPILWVLVFSVLLPQAGNLLGWMSAEIGRQPWIVYGLLRTKDGLSPNVVAGQVWTSIIIFGLIYSLLLAVFLYLLNDKIQHGPEIDDQLDSGRHRA